MKTPRRVLVVGGGNAGLVAALSAREHGAEVLLLEAAGEDERGGNSRFSGAMFRVVHGGKESLGPLFSPHGMEMMERVEFGPYLEAAYQADSREVSDGLANPDLTDLYISRSYETLAWMMRIGVPFEPTTKKFASPEYIASGKTVTLPPGGAIRVEGEGEGLVHSLYRAAEAAGVEIQYSAPAHDLLVSGSAVHGVRVRRRDAYEDIEGIVILASGGFQADPAARRRYLGQGWDLVRVRGSRFDRGTMTFAALRAGAQAAGHWGGCHASPQDAACPEFGDLALSDRMSRYSYPLGLLVNMDGERFLDEGSDHFLNTYAKTGAAINAQPRARAIQIFDQQTVGLLEERYESGQPIVADSLSNLALLLGVDGDRLASTVERYNDSTRPGAFDPLVKDGLSTRNLTPPKSNWALPLNEPPYVAYPVVGGITFTYGGLKVNELGEVMNNENLPMPGLYAIGECAGGFFYHNYPGGAGLTRGAVTGRIAGAEAAAVAMRSGPTGDDVAS